MLPRTDVGWNKGGWEFCNWHVTMSLHWLRNHHCVFLPGWTLLRSFACIHLLAPSWFGCHWRSCSLKCIYKTCFPYSFFFFLSKFLHLMQLLHITWTLSKAELKGFSWEASAERFSTKVVNIWMFFIAFCWISMKHINFKIDFLLVLTKHMNESGLVEDSEVLIWYITQTIWKVVIEWIEKLLVGHQMILQMPNSFVKTTTLAVWHGWTSNHTFILSILMS